MFIESMRNKAGKNFRNNLTLKFTFIYIDYIQKAYKVFLPRTGKYKDNKGMISAESLMFGEGDTEATNSNVKHK